MKNVINVLLSFLVFIGIAFADLPHIQFSREVEPKEFAFSTNIIFVIDASSTINLDPDVSRKFDIAWRRAVSMIASDEAYFAAWVFHDSGAESFRPWVEARHESYVNRCSCLTGATPRNDLCEWRQTYQWVKANTGIYSYGRTALGLAIRQTNELNSHGAEGRRLTVVLITDGGFSEAARARSFQPIMDVVRDSQQWRVDNGLELATICTIGLENTNPSWGLAVKRPNWECQRFLRNLGSTYNGGYFYVHAR